MSGIKRKAVIKHQPATRRVGLATVHKAQRGNLHRHVCTNTDCRLIYEDACFSPERNGRCRPCTGRRRTWVQPNGLHDLDPRPCCHDNTQLVVDNDDLARFTLAGPGPWFQCQTCKRTHGHPCTDPALLARPTTTEGTS